MFESKIYIRQAKTFEFKSLGQIMVNVYEELDGFPSKGDQPRYYDMLANIGDLTKNPGVKLLVAVSEQEKILGGVVYFSDMKYYGSGGTAPNEKNASGIRLLAVSTEARGSGAGKLLTQACIDLAKKHGNKRLILHTTNAMPVAWGMYEKMGFKRFPHIDFHQGEMEVFGFELKIGYR